MSTLPSDQAERMLELEQVEVAYGKARAVVDGVSLSLSCGQVTALLGPPGSGKSTLLRAIAGLETLRSGSIRFAGEVWSDDALHRPPEERRCGVVFQDYALFPHLNALNNVAYGLRTGPKSQRLEEARTQLERVELGHRAKAFPHELSGGEQQRVALARALAPSPDIVLLDEPFSGLDRRLRGELRDTTARALRASGAATLLVTHDAEEALALADTIALMNEGQVIQTGLPDSLYLKPTSLAAARLLGDIEVLQGEVRDGVVTTRFGPLKSGNDLPEGASVSVLVRPEGFILNQGGDAGLWAEVIERRLSLGHAIFTCRIKNGPDIQVRATFTTPAPVGDQVQITLDPDFVSLVRS